jgi:four helix bundle protein
MNDFRKLDVWLKAIDFSTRIHRLTKQYPKEEIYGLVSQLRRAAVSISSNIAEGCSRTSKKDFARFLEFSIGSAFEIESQLLVSKNLNYITEIEYNALREELIHIENMLIKLKNSLFKD